jgi:putative isomerase
MVIVPGMVLALKNIVKTEFWEGFFLGDHRGLKEDELTSGKLDYVPRIWGRAQTFAPSGIDTATDWFHPFVGQTMPDVPGMLFHVGPDSSRDFEVVFGGHADAGPIAGTLEGLKPEVIGPDILGLNLDLAGEGSVVFRLAWPDRGTIVGEAWGKGANPCLFTTCAVHQDLDGHGDGPGVFWPGAIAGASGRYTVLNLGHGGPGKFVISGVQDGRAVRRALDCDFARLFSRGMHFYEKLRLPATDDAELKKTHVKACAIMKVNFETACGEISTLWTTPDRWPHRHMWLWDAAFNSLGAQHLEPVLGRDCIRAVLSKQHPSGFIPHTMAPDRSEDSSMTQPPILAWASWELHSNNPDRGFLSKVYPALKDYLAWDLKHMDRLETGLLQWQFAGADSGMDNSPRFNDGPDFDAVDLNCFMANECRFMAEIAREIGFDDECGIWTRLRDELVRKINGRLWHVKDGFYYDRRKKGAWIRIKTVDGFAPLFSGVASEEQADRLVKEHLLNEEEFWPRFPVPSVALDEDCFELDMWRGPTWINYNYMITRGLEDYGYADAARELERRTLSEISLWRSRRSSIYEFYDPFGTQPPQELKRKRRVRRWPEDGIPVISDFFWSSALFVDLMARRFGLSA